MSKLVHRYIKNGLVTLLTLVLEGSFLAVSYLRLPLKTLLIKTPPLKEFPYENASLKKYPPKNTNKK